MPKATAPRDSQRHDLKSLPEGFVELKPLTYGQYLHRRDMAMDMTLKNPDVKTTEMALSMANEAVTQYEYENCIVDHNLEDETGRKLNFSIKQDFTNLDPKVGEEISSLIDAMHSWEDRKEELFQSSE